MDNIKKLQTRLNKVEKELETCRTSVLQDGWQTQRFAKKSRKWDILSKEKHWLKMQIESCNSDDGDDMCENCNCWKHTRAMCS